MEGEKKWYVVHTYSGYENKVKTNLEKRVESMAMQEKIFRVLVPTEEELEDKGNGKKKIVKKKVFPGYVLVEMIMGDDSWYVVRNTPGVTGFVGSGTKPIPLMEDEVKVILGNLTEEGAKLKISLQVGQHVRVKSGPFKDFIGSVEEIDHEKGKIKVEVNMFGRDTPVELDHTQVEEL